MLTTRGLWGGVALVALYALTLSTAQAAGAPYQTGFTRWRAADGNFGGWTLSGAALNSGALVLNAVGALSGTDPAGAYNGRNFYNGGAYLVGETTSPEVTTTFSFSEAIPSWNADTPPGTWIETQLRARINGHWTKWYNLGVWASDTGTVERHSVTGQGDSDGYVATDTLVISAKKVTANAVQVRVRLFSADANGDGTADATPTVRAMSVAISAAAPSKAPATSAGNPALWHTLLNVPECSQMVYPDGGEVWCSPTATSMVLGYWGHMPGACEPRVRAAVAAVYDWIYDGHGNWPFNTAYAGGLGFEGYVARLTSLAEAEPWVAAGVPVIFSFAWKKNTLMGAAIPSSNGHLAALVGFDAAGNPIVNDPAAATDADVQRTYQRAELEARWLEASGGTVYLIYPTGHATPPLP